MQIKRYNADGKLAGIVNLSESQVIGFGYDRAEVTFGLMRRCSGEFIMPPPGGRLEISALEVR